MASKIVLKRSRRDELLWSFHVILDSVPEGAAGREQFAWKVLLSFGVSEWGLGELVTAVCNRLPTNLEATDMTEVLAVFEDVLKIEWHEDLTPVTDTARQEFRASVLRIIAESKPSELPRQVAARLV